jgi:hypothetical protein
MLISAVPPGIDLAACGHADKTVARMRRTAATSVVGKVVVVM